MLQLNLRLHSIKFASDDYQTNSHSVCIFTFPDMQKQSIQIDSEIMNNSGALFKIKYNENIDNIVICLMKKGFFKKEEIIASACINSKEIDENNKGCKKIDLFEPIPQFNENTHKERKFVGSMKANFSFKESFNIEKYGFSYNQIEQRTLRSKYNNLNGKMKNCAQYIFN